MYINREGHACFMSIFNSLEEADRQKWLKALKKVGGEVMGVSWRKITIDDYDRRDREHVDPNEIVTPEMMSKAYRAIWEGRNYEASNME